MTANPISYQEIDAWNRLTGNGVSEFEVACIRALDSVRLKSINKVNDNG